MLRLRKLLKSGNKVSCPQARCRVYKKSSWLISKCNSSWRSVIGHAFYTCSSFQYRSECGKQASTIERSWSRTAVNNCLKLAVQCNFYSISIRQRFLRVKEVPWVPLYRFLLNASVYSPITSLLGPFLNLLQFSHRCPPFSITSSGNGVTETWC